MSQHPFVCNIKKMNDILGADCPPARPFFHRTGCVANNSSDIGIVPPFFRPFDVPFDLICLLRRITITEIYYNSAGPFFFPVKY